MIAERARKRNTTTMKKNKPKPRARPKKAGQVREPSVAYTVGKRRVPPNDHLPGFDLVGSGVPQTDPTYAIEAGFRRYGVEGEDVFLGLAARCVIEAPERGKEFEFFQYERGLQVLDSVTHDRQMDAFLGRVCGGPEAVSHLPVWYQYFVGRRFREGSGKFFTPRTVARSMAMLLPFRENMIVCDPTCGGGTFLGEAAKLLNGAPCQLIGNDVDCLLVGLTEVVLFLTCHPGQVCKFFCNNLYDRGDFLETYSGRIDCILANPPFSLPLEHVGTKSPLFTMGYHNSDAVFLDVCLDLLKDGGHLVCLLPHSIVVNTDYTQLRSQVERAWEMRGVITLPEGMFYMTASTTTRADIIHLCKKSKSRSISGCTGKAYFGNAPSVGVALNSRDTMFRDNALEEAAKTIRARGCIPDFARVE
jgi:SAM-dependent methyltransferase